jgi:tetratricopeptide (TPR) repeat protein
LAKLVPEPEIRPMSFPSQQLLQRARQYHKAGDAAQAKFLCGRIPQADPEFADALHILGVIAAQAGDPDEAIRLFNQAIGIRPHFPEAIGHLGNALCDKNQIDDAIVAYRKALSMNPNSAAVLLNLGEALRDKKQLDEALGCLQKAIALRPNLSQAHGALGNVYHDQKKTEEAIALYRKAIALDAKNADAHNNLGVALSEAGHFEDAIAVLQKALEIDPDSADANYHLSIAFRGSGRLDDGIRSVRKAIELKPDFAEARTALGMALLTRGDFVQGWDQLEWRWKLLEFEDKYKYALPRWNPAAGDCRAVLLTPEQGLGDIMQFIRFAPLVAARCPRVVFRCPKQLASLLRGVEGVTDFIAPGSPVPPVDAYCPLLSLPYVLRTAGDIPGKVPYVTPDAERVGKWSHRLAGEQRFKIGISWAGSAVHKNDANRSATLAAFAPLADIQNLAIYSLQKGPPAEQAKTPPPGIELIDYTEELTDFADTAALIANLDLVISVDTAIVHLTGATARPVWTLLAFEPDWRWQLDRTDTPWYPTMRLFRQKTAGDWNGVVSNVAAALNERALAHRG